MDDQTPEMEKVTQEMRDLMAAWLEQPDNAAIKARYEEAQARYQRMFLAYKQRQRAGTA
jgi:hypothetical protein